MKLRFFGEMRSRHYDFPENRPSQDELDRFADSFSKKLRERLAGGVSAECQEVVFGPFIAKFASENRAIILTNNAKDIQKASGFLRPGNQPQPTFITVTESLKTRAARPELVRQMINTSESAVLRPEILESAAVVGLR